MNRFVTCIISALAAVIVNGCTDSHTTDHRAAEPSLTREHAQARGARISEVSYDLEFELDGEAPEYTGRVIIVFSLSDVRHDLTVDFFGGTVSSVQINNRMQRVSLTAQGTGAAGDMSVSYNGFFLTLSAGSLRMGMNTVGIAFSHPYSSDGSGMYRFTDPVDGRSYLYTDFQPYDQNRLFPSFDQPDLKACYSTQVTAPADWQVISIVGKTNVAVEFGCEDGVIDGLELTQTAPPDWPALRTHRTQLGLYDFDNGNVAIRLLPVTYSGERTEVTVGPGERCPGLIYANHGDWDFARVELDAGTLATIRDHLNDFDDALLRSMLWQGVYETVLYQRLTPEAFIEFALANLGSESVDDVARLALRAMQKAWSYLQRLEQDNVARQRVAARIEDFLWQAFQDSTPGSDRQLLVFDNYVSAATSDPGLERLAGLFDDPRLPEGFLFDQDRRWNVLERLSGFDYPGIDKLVSAEQQSDQSDKGRRRMLSVVAARPDPEQQRRLMQQLLDPGSGLSVADARASAGGLFPVHQHAQQLQIVGEVFDKLQFVSDNIEPGYFRSITGGLLGVICDQNYLAQLEQAVSHAEILHPLLRKRLLDMRFEVRRCLAIGAASGPGK